VHACALNATRVQSVADGVSCLALALFISLYPSATLPPCLPPSSGWLRVCASVARRFSPLSSAEISCRRHLSRVVLSREDAGADRRSLSETETRSRSVRSGLRDPARDRSRVSEMILFTAMPQRRLSRLSRLSRRIARRIAVSLRARTLGREGWKS